MATDYEARANALIRDTADRLNSLIERAAASGLYPMDDTDEFGDPTGPAIEEARRVKALALHHLAGLSHALRIAPSKAEADANVMPQ